MVASRIADRLGELPPPRWGPPLPRATVVSRIIERLEAEPGPRWDPPLPRCVVASRIAERLVPTTTPATREVTPAEETKAAEPADAHLASADEETKESEPPGMVDEETKVGDAADDPVVPTSDIGTDSEWLLRFDGACRANPGPGGAGAALFKPSGAVMWTCSLYMPSSSETNNTAEYCALLLGARAAADHGVTSLRVEGDSTLVIQQVRGIFAARKAALRRLRNQVKLELARVGSYSLHHIDRQDNGHADRLANAALDRRGTQVECCEHTHGEGCSSTEVTAEASEIASPRAPAPAERMLPDIAMLDADESAGDVDDGEVYAPMRIGPDA
ncbi:reverse transcriptase, partial [Phytophthora megakarya]